MEIEFSTKIKGAVSSISFDIEEIRFLRQPIIKAFEKEIKRLEKKVESIENDENNEGQATYSVVIDECNSLIKEYSANIVELNQNRVRRGNGNRN